MATNYARASYTEVYDVCTRAGTPTMIGIHTPTSSRPLALMSGLWTQFKKVRYSGCKVSMVPASTLPADPLQLSTDASQLDSIDPRDMLNPVLFRGYIGESLGYFLDNALGTVVTGYTRSPYSSMDVSTASSSSANANFKSWYYQNLISREWKKTSVQSGFSKSGLHPRIWSLGVDHPLLPVQISEASALAYGPTVDTWPQPPMSAIQNSANSNISTSQANSVYVGTTLPSTVDEATTPTDTGEYQPKSPTFRTIKSVPLGWQDTITNNSIVPTNNYGGGSKNITTGDVHYTNIGKHFMALIVLPPSEKTIFYFRMVVKHYYEFKNFRYAFVNQPGAGSAGNRTYPVTPVSAQSALAIPMEWTVGYPEFSSKDVGVYNTDTGDYAVTETGTLDVLNGEADFITDSVS